MNRRGIELALAVVGLLLGSEPARAVVVTHPEIEFRWATAGGPVAGYAIWVARNGEDFSDEATHTTPWTKPRLKLTGQPGETLRVRVAAFGIRGRFGPRSAPSDTVEFVSADDLFRKPLRGLAVPSAGAADFDGDGSSDIAVLDPRDGSVTVSLLEGASPKASGVVSYDASEGWEPVGLGDLDGDFRTDILFRERSSGAMVVWLMRGLDPPLAHVLSHSAAPEWILAAVGEFNGDRRADLVWRHAVSGQTAVWLMQGPRVAASALLPGATDPSWEIQGVGDWGQGRPSTLVWRNQTTGQNAIWIVRDLGILLQAFLPPWEDSDWSIEAVLDLDLDGDGDVFWRHRPTGKHAVWYMTGTSASADIPVAGPDPDQTWRLLEADDFDGDGALDLLWHDTEFRRYRITLQDGAVAKSRIRLQP